MFFTLDNHEKTNGVVEETSIKQGLQPIRELSCGDISEISVNKIRL